MLNFRSGLYDVKPKLAQLLAADPTALDDIRLPDSVTLADFKAAALVQLGSLDTLFHTPAELKTYLPIWSAGKLPQWERVEAALAAEYDPIFTRFYARGGKPCGVYGNHNPRRDYQHR